MAHKVKKYGTQINRRHNQLFLKTKGELKYCFLPDHNFRLHASIRNSKITKNSIIICFRHLTNDSRWHFSFAIYSEHINSAFVLKNQRFSITSFLILNHSVGLKLCATNARLSFRKWVGRGANFVQLSTRFSLGFY